MSEPRKDTSTRPLDHYERCVQPMGHLEVAVAADVVVGEAPYCADHAPLRLADILRGLPNADRYEVPDYDPDIYSDLAGWAS